MLKLSLSTESLSVLLREAAWMEWSHGDWCPPTLTAANFRANVTIPESLCNVTTYEMDSILCRPDGHRAGNVRLRLRWPGGAGERGWHVVTCELWMIGQCFVWLCAGVRHGHTGSQHADHGVWWARHEPATLTSQAAAARHYITQQTSSASSAEYDFRRFWLLSISIKLLWFCIWMNCHISTYLSKFVLYCQKRHTLLRPVWLASILII